MPLGSSNYDPFWIFRWPFSGNVNERVTAPWFSPSLTVNYAGDAKIEDRVVTEVASYGKQLGWLTEIAIALAKKQDPPADGFVTVTDDGRMVLHDWPVSGRCDGTLPLPGCFGPELSQRGSRNEVALNIKSIVDGSMGAEKALSGSC
jgi:hypothetical protein